jgi:hypothetical protein
MTALTPEEVSSRLIEAFRIDRMTHPTKAEIAKMESAFAWLPAVAMADREAYDALRLWATRMAQPIKLKGAKSLRSISASLGLQTMQIGRRKDRALSLIVERIAA